MNEIESYKNKSIQRLQNKYKTTVSFVNPHIHNLEEKLPVVKELKAPMKLLLTAYIIPLPIAPSVDKIASEVFVENKIMILEENNTLAESIKILQDENNNIKKVIKQLEERKNAIID